MLLVNDADDATLTPWQSQNFALWSDDLTQATWAKNAATITVDAATLSNGLLLDKVCEDATTGNHYIRQTLTFPAGFVAVSFYVGQAERTQLQLTLYNVATTDTVVLAVDLAAKTVTPTVSGASASLVTAELWSDPSGTPPLAQRVMLVVKIATAGSYQLRAFLRKSGVISYAGTVGEGLYMGRFQCELGAAVTTSMATTSAANTAAGFVASLPASNLQLGERTRITRTTGLSGMQGVSCSWTASRTVSALVLYGHNLSSAAYTRLQAFDGPDCTGNLVYDSGNNAESANAWQAYTWPGVSRAPAAKYSVLWLPGPLAVRSFRLMVRDTGANTDGYWQARRLLVGDVLEPRWGAEYGATMQWVDTSEQRRTQGGSMRVDVRALFRRLSFNLSLLTELERTKLMEAVRYAGLQREVFVTLYPSSGGALERDHAVLGRITSLPAASIDGPGIYSAPLVIEES